MEYHKCDWAHCVASPLLVVFLVQNALLLANFSPPPPTLFLPPRNFGFALEQKLRNAFSKIFLVQICQNFGKHVLKFVFKTKKKFEVHFKNSFSAYDMIKNMIKMECFIRIEYKISRITIIYHVSGAHMITNMISIVSCFLFIYIS
jgi:hypothetical protein